MNITWAQWESADGRVVAADIDGSRHHNIYLDCGSEIAEAMLAWISAGGVPAAYVPPPPPAIVPLGPSAEAQELAAQRATIQQLQAQLAAVTGALQKAAI